MKKKVALASTLTASTLTAGIAVVNQWTKKILYREHLQRNQVDDWYKVYHGEKVKIKNHKAMALQAYLFECPNATCTVIGVHGLKSSAYDLREMVSYMKTLFGNVNVLLYDSNAHGLSDGYIRGLGYRDVMDLMYFNTYVLQRYGQDHRVIMYGQGTGANTILNASGLGKLKNVDMILSEGAYDNAYRYLSTLCQRELKVSHMICGPVIRKIVKNELKLDLKKMDTVSLVKKNSIPTIYIHSKEDQNVPFQSVFPLYNHDSSNKLLFPIKKDYLYECQDFDDEYMGYLTEFIKEVL